MLPLPLIGVEGLPLPSSPPFPPRISPLRLPLAAESRSRMLPRSALLLRLNKPSPLPGGDVASPDVADPGADERPDLIVDGVLSFQAATILRTDVSGERGDVCGRRREPVGVSVPEFVLVKVFVFVPEGVNVLVFVWVNVFVLVLVYVLVYALGLRYPVPVRVSVVVGLRTLDVASDSDVAPLVGGERNDDIEIGPEPEDTELFVGDEGLELYPYPVVLYPYPVTLSKLGVERR